MKPLLTAILMLVVFTAHPASKEKDFQDQVAEAFKADSSFLFVRNDTNYPVELRKQQLGKFLVCLTTDFEKLNLVEVVDDMFRKEETALVRCMNGLILVSRGYI